MRGILLAVALAGCLTDTVKDGTDTSLPDGDFTRDNDVRIRAPYNGETLSSTDFSVKWEVGQDIAAIRLELDESIVSGPTPIQTLSGTIDVTADPGRHRLTLWGLDEDGVELAHYGITVRVADDALPWVTIVSPSDGATVPNPVTFAVDGHDDLDEIELLADGWSIGFLDPGDTFTYSFTGTGYERTIEAVGWANGEPIATDSISLLVEAGTEPVESDFNDVILDLIDTYPTDGSYGYYWPADTDWLGTTRDIYYLDELVAEGDPEHRSFCVGLTWEVFMRAFTQVDAETGGDGSLNGLTVDDLTEFRIDWFVRDLWGAGVVDAVENYGIGERVTDWEDAHPGDQIQFWRHSGSGHNNVFIEWERDEDDDIIGVTYWSTQSSTDGVGYNTEYFGTGGSKIDPNYFFLARIYMPEDWITWF